MMLRPTASLIFKRLSAGPAGREELMELTGYASETALRVALHRLRRRIAPEGHAITTVCPKGRGVRTGATYALSRMAAVLALVSGLAACVQPGANVSPETARRENLALACLEYARTLDRVVAGRERGDVSDHAWDAARIVRHTIGPKCENQDRIPPAELQAVTAEIRTMLTGWIVAQTGPRG